MKKFFRVTLTAILIVTYLLTATTVDAAIQTFDGTGKYIMSEFETEDIARQRAIQRAKQDAQDKAVEALKTFSRSVDSQLTDAEIFAVVNNSFNVSDVKIESKPADDSILTATLKISVDKNDVLKFLDRNYKERVPIVRQNNNLREVVAENDRQIADLTEQYNRATTPADKDKIRQQIAEADRDFLANEKLDESLRLAYAKDFDGAIKLCNEALELNPNFAMAYTNRGIAYGELKQYERALRDFYKALEINPNLTFAKNNRAACLKALGR